MSAGIRLLVSDIDGTLVRDDKTLSDANRDAVRALEADGVAVTLISARPPSGIFWLARTLGLAGPFAAFNGGTLFDADGTIRFAHRIDAADAATMLQLSRVGGATPWVFAHGRWFVVDPGNPHLSRERRASGVEPVVRTDFTRLGGCIDKIVCVSDDQALLMRIEEQARATLGERATIARSQVHYLDITHRLAI
jgi:hydroxymethylpyrimidine pyrophosphatase-like HAD family hydrolase